MRMCNLVDHYEIINFAVGHLSMNIKDACKILDEIRPMYEIKSHDYIKSDFQEDSDNSFSNECKKVMLLFMNNMGVEAITIIDS